MEPRQEGINCLDGAVGLSTVAPAMGDVVSKSRTVPRCRLLAQEPVPDIGNASDWDRVICSLPLGQASVLLGAIYTALGAGDRTRRPNPLVICAASLRDSCRS